MIDLYTAASGNGRRATIMLEECDLDYVAHRIEIGDGAQKPADFMELNPQGTVPMIIDWDGPSGRPLKLLQSGAILFYLARKAGKFLPKDELARAITYEWTIYVLTDVVGANTAMYLAGTQLGDAGMAAAKFFESALLDRLRLCDRRLGDSPFLASLEPSIADFALFPVTVSRRAMLDATGDLQNLKRWAAEIAARPGVKRALEAVV